jgi:hypothetical protein
MRPSRSSTRLAVPAFPDSHGPRCMCERSRTRPCCRSGPIPTLGLRWKGAAMGPPPSPSFQVIGEGATFARSYLFDPQPNDGLGDRERANAAPLSIYPTRKRSRPENPLRTEPTGEDRRIRDCPPAEPSRDGIGDTPDPEQATSSKPPMTPGWEPAARNGQSNRKDDEKNQNAEKAQEGDQRAGRPQGRRDPHSA